MAKRTKGEFVINRKKWLTGEAVNVGIESTLLDLPTGLMCCLGQACQQLGVKRDDLLTGDPDTIIENVSEAKRPGLIKAIKNAGLIRRTQDIWSPCGYVNTKTAGRLMEINDNTAVTRNERESAVTRLFKKIGWSVRFSGKYPDYKAIGAKR